MPTTHDDTIHAAVSLLNTLPVTEDIADAINLLMRSTDPYSRPTGVKVIWKSTRELTKDEKKRVIREVISIRKPKKTTKRRAQRVLAHGSLRIGFVNPDIYRGYGEHGVIFALPAQAFKKLVLD